MQGTWHYSLYIHPHDSQFSSIHPHHSRVRYVFRFIIIFNNIHSHDCWHSSSQFALFFHVYPSSWFVIFNIHPHDSRVRQVLRFIIIFTIILVILYGHPHPSWRDWFLQFHAHDYEFFMFILVIYVRDMSLDSRHHSEHVLSVCVTWHIRTCGMTH